MTKILSWNIQCGLGVDGHVDLKRIAEVSKAFDEPEIICFQEVARFDPESDKGQAADQYQILAELFPDYSAYYGPAIDRLYPGEANRRQFGNMILSRLPVLQVFNHQLPQPCPPEPCKHMPRQNLEVVVELPDGPLRVNTTHLEYHCAAQREAQASHLCVLQEEVLSNLSYSEVAPDAGPYAAFSRPERSIICGDFNAVVGDDCYRLLSGENTHRSPLYSDAWQVVHKDKEHAPTCGVYDPEQWPEGPHARDFFFITESLKTSVMDVSVNLKTDASDHQPVLLELR